MLVVAALLAGCIPPEGQSDDERIAVVAKCRAAGMVVRQAVGSRIYWCAATERDMGLERAGQRN